MGVENQKPTENINEKCHTQPLDQHWESKDLMWDMGGAKTI